MHFPRIILGAETFAAPCRVEDWVDSSPRVGLSIKECVERVKNRMIKEVTTKNGGVLLRSAFGEVSDLIHEEEKVKTQSPRRHRKMHSQ